MAVINSIWISVKNKLPAEDEAVLFYRPDTDEVCYGHWSPGGWIALYMLERTIKIDDYPPGMYIENYSGDVWGHPIEYITHWARLPKGPDSDY